MDVIWRDQKELEIKAETVLVEYSNKIKPIKEAFRLSHNEKREYHEQTIGNLSGEYMRLQNRLDQAYLGKLDVTISKEFW